MALLGNPKLRGKNAFFDNWNQFPERQDENGWVRWEYKHYRDHGPLFSEEFFQAIDRGLEKTKQCSRENKFPLVGILYAPDGSRYTGEAAKGGKNPYYRNLKSKKRFPVKQIHKAIFSRLGELMRQNGLLEEVISKGKNHKEGGLSRLRREREKTQAEITRPKEAEEGLGDALKAIVLEKGDNLTEMIQVVIDEKNRTVRRLDSLTEKASELEAMECRFLKSLDGGTFKRSAKALVDNMQQIPPLELKKLVKTLIPKAVIVPEERGNRLELLYNLSSEAPPKKAFSLIKMPTYNPLASLRELEVKSWTSSQNGRSDWI